MTDIQIDEPPWEPVYKIARQMIRDAGTPAPVNGVVWRVLTAVLDSGEVVLTAERDEARAAMKQVFDEWAQWQSQAMELDKAAAHERERAEKAEAALERVRALADEADRIAEAIYGMTSSSMSTTRVRRVIEGGGDDD